MFRVEILHTANCEGPDTWKQHHRTSGEETRPLRCLTTPVPCLKNCTRTHRKVHSWRPTSMYVLHLHTTRWRSSIFVIWKRENRQRQKILLSWKSSIFTPPSLVKPFLIKTVRWKWKKKKKWYCTKWGNRWSYHDRVKVIPLPFHISLLLLSWVHSLPGWLCHRFNMLIWLENRHRGLTAASVAGHTAKTGNNDDPRRKWPAIRSPVGAPKQNSAEA